MAEVKNALEVILDNNYKLIDMDKLAHTAEYYKEYSDNDDLFMEKTRKNLSLDQERMKLLEESMSLIPAATIIAKNMIERRGEGNGDIIQTYDELFSVICSEYRLIKERIDVTTVFLKGKEDPDARV